MLRDKQQEVKLKGKECVCVCMCVCVCVCYLVQVAQVILSMMVWSLTNFADGSSNTCRL